MGSACACPSVLLCARGWLTAASYLPNALADAHGEVKVNCWEKPTSISEWKEEHIVIVVLAAWGVTITSAMKIFGGGDSEPAPVAEAK